MPSYVEVISEEEVKEGSFLFKSPHLPRVAIPRWLSIFPQIIFVYLASDPIPRVAMPGSLGEYLSVQWNLAEHSYYSFLQNLVAIVLIDFFPNVLFEWIFAQFH